MNKISVEQAYSSPSLDAACAKALGWKVAWLRCRPSYDHLGFEVNVKSQGRPYECSSDVMLPCYVFHCMCPPRPGDITVNGHSIYCYRVVPEWSSRIEHAWELIHVLETAGQGENIIRITNGDGDSRDIDFIPRTRSLQSISYTMHGNHRYDWPIAICRAFLLAHSITEIEIPEV